MRLFCSLNKRVFLAAALLIILSAVGMIIFSLKTPKNASKILTKVTPAPASISEKDYALAKSANLDNCEMFIPPALQSLKREKYKTSYGLDGYLQNAIWESSSQPPEKFSLKELPKVFLIYNQKNELQGCGTSSSISSEKAKVWNKEMEKVQCEKDIRFFATGKAYDTQILQIKISDSTIVSLIYKTDIKINQKNLICK